MLHGRMQVASAWHYLGSSNFVPVLSWSMQARPRDNVELIERAKEANACTKCIESPITLSYTRPAIQKDENKAEREKLLV